MINKYGNVNVSVGGIPYAGETNPSLDKPQMKLKSYITEIGKKKSDILSVDKKLEVESYLFDADVIGKNMRDLHHALNPLRKYKGRGREQDFELNKEGQLIIGKVKVGAPIHFHTNGFSINLVGRKHWIVFPPYKSFYTNIPMWPFLKFNHYKNHAKDALHFTQYPGEIVFIPACWSHGTIIIDDISVSVAENLDPSYITDANIL